MVGLAALADARPQARMMLQRVFQESALLFIVYNEDEAVFGDDALAGGPTVCRSIMAPAARTDLHQRLQRRVSVLLGALLPAVLKTLGEYWPRMMWL